MVIPYDHEMDEIDIKGCNSSITLLVFPVKSFYTFHRDIRGAMHKTSQSSRAPLLVSVHVAPDCLKICRRGSTVSNRRSKSRIQSLLFTVVDVSGLRYQCWLTGVLRSLCTMSSMLLIPEGVDPCRSRLDRCFVVISRRLSSPW